MNSDNLKISIKFDGKMTKDQKYLFIKLKDLGRLLTYN